MRGEFEKMKNDIFVNNLYSLSKNVKAGYKKIIGYCLLNELECNFNDLTETIYNLSNNKKDNPGMEDYYIKLLKNNFEEEEDIQILLNNLIKSISMLRDAYYQDINNLDELLSNKQKRVLNHTFNFDVQFLLGL